MNTPTTPFAADQSLNFSFSYDGRPHLGQISAEALRAHFGAEPKVLSLVSAYWSNAEQIQRKAMERFEKGAREPVMVRAGDFV